MANQPDFFPPKADPPLAGNNYNSTPPHKSIGHWAIVAVTIVSVISYFMTSYYYALWPFGDLLMPIPTSIPYPTQRACTEEAKLCPDGSAVGRTGPNCEFAACPEEADTSTTSTSLTADWQTYHNEEYGFEFKYPTKNKIVNEEDDTYTGLIHLRYKGDQSEDFVIEAHTTRTDNMGVSYCGAYAYTDKSRCKIINPASGNPIIVSWGSASDPAYANTGLSASMDLVFSLKPQTLESKDIFTQILSTFKFTR
ncbi:MAG: hypothetical protein Q7S43_00270 [bacterium]|nr:hypothetical protein [bacterium]